MEMSAAKRLAVVSCISSLLMCITTCPEYICIGVVTKKMPNFPGLFFCAKIHKAYKKFMYMKNPYEICTFHVGEQRRLRRLCASACSLCMNRTVSLEPML